MEWKEILGDELIELILESVERRKTESWVMAIEKDDLPFYSETGHYVQSVLKAVNAIPNGL